MTDSPLHSGHWSTFASDPMDPAAISHRRSAINAARRPTITDRTSFLRDSVRGRRLLDIGVVDHALISNRSDRWLHGQLAEVAAWSLGVDVLDEPVRQLREQGYNVECIDITAGGRPDGAFDVIVAGEVAEHLGNVGGLFDAAADLLAPAGRFLLTTPNPFAIWRVYQHLRGRPHENVDHVTYLGAWGVAELADRAGLRLLSFRGIAPLYPVGRKAKLVSWGHRRRLLRFVPEALAESILYELVRADVAVPNVIEPG